MGASVAYRKTTDSSRRNVGRGIPRAARNVTIRVCPPTGRVIPALERDNQSSSLCDDGYRLTSGARNRHERLVLAWSSARLGSLACASFRRFTDDCDTRTAQRERSPDPQRQVAALPGPRVSSAFSSSIYPSCAPGSYRPVDTARSRTARLDTRLGRDDISASGCRPPLRY